MRLDKFLKVTRIIKRRTIAKELADNGTAQIITTTHSPALGSLIPIENLRFIHKEQINYTTKGIIIQYFLLHF